MIRFTGYEREIECDAERFGDALSQLVEKFPVLRNVLVDATGRIRAMHMVFVNGESISRGGDQDRRLAANDVVHIVTAIAGG